jgi:hypothetical protein
VFVRTDADGVELHDADVFTDLHAELGGLTGQDAGARFAEHGCELSGEYAWLDISWLRAAGPDTDAWLEKFDAMIEYARSKGWVDDSGARVRAHVATD